VVQWFVYTQFDIYVSIRVLLPSVVDPKIVLFTFKE
jgi:hypothetical protein